MNGKQIKSIIKKGEGIGVEFKECKTTNESFIAENSNKSHSLGLINPEKFVPYPKNPSIARVFKEIGWADELGSGTRNLFRYCKLYCGNDPELFDGNYFSFSLALTA